MLALRLNVPPMSFATGISPDQHYLHLDEVLKKINNLQLHLRTSYRVDVDPSEDEVSCIGWKVMRIYNEFVEQLRKARGCLQPSPKMSTAIEKIQPNFENGSPWKWGMDSSEMILLFETNEDIVTYRLYLEDWLLRLQEISTACVAIAFPSWAGEGGSLLQESLMTFCQVMNQIKYHLDFHVTKSCGLSSVLAAIERHMTSEWKKCEGPKISP